MGRWRRGRPVPGRRWRRRCWCCGRGRARVVGLAPGIGGLAPDCWRCGACRCRRRDGRLSRRGGGFACRRGRRWRIGCGSNGGWRFPLGCLGCRSRGRGRGLARRSGCLIGDRGCGCVRGEDGGVLFCLVVVLLMMPHRLLPHHQQPVAADQQQLSTRLALRRLPPRRHRHRPHQNSRAPRRNLVRDR